ncbi:hypothetical protein [Amycolatopsis sp. CA-230715]|uniref:hypothetical protein n=1 Tax=Amycolatopsis sp. CA-230715 TaxID=2745196 RepID=UPI0020B20F7E|nr:hypothetical protein [Amycolatopsis sp. CA-230715]
MESAQLRRQCHRRVRGLVRSIGLPAPWDINEFVDRLERHRGRPIDLCAVQWTPGESSGAWRAHHDHDVIAFCANTTSVHQDAIIPHELAHMIAEHRGRCVLSEEEAQRRAPDLAPAAFAHLLDRVNLPGEEQEAELTARLVLARIARDRPAARGASSLAREVEAVFG